MLSHVGLYRVTLSLVALWITELPGGGVAFGEAADEAEARTMIESQERGSVTWREGRDNAPGRWRWTVVQDGGKTHHGWADSEAEGWAQVREALQRPSRGASYRGPRGLWSLPPA
jgi:hypothetical protein